MVHSHVVSGVTGGSVAAAGCTSVVGSSVSAGAGVSGESAVSAVVVGQRGRSVFPRGSQQGFSPSYGWYDVVSTINTSIIPTKTKITVVVYVCAGVLFEHHHLQLSDGTSTAAIIGWQQQ